MCMSGVEITKSISASCGWVEMAFYILETAQTPPEATANISKPAIL